MSEGIEAQAGTRRIAVIINPASGVRGGADAARRRARLAADLIGRRGGLAEIFVTERPGHARELARSAHARELARSAHARGVDVVAAWGGDGTVNEVGSALAFTDTPLAITPSGSGNGLARELGISRRPARALADALDGRTRRIDLGEIAGHLFVNVAGVGFDAEIARQFAAGGRRGLAGYAWLTVGAFLRYRPLSYTIEAGEWQRRVNALLVCVANSRQFGNGAVIAPDAIVDDGMLNLVVVGSRPASRLIRELPAMFRGRVTSLPDVWSLAVTEARIAGAAPLLFHVDGEPVLGGCQLLARVHPRALNLRVPRAAPA